MFFSPKSKFTKKLYRENLPYKLKRVYIYTILVITPVKAREEHKPLNVINLKFVNH